MPLFTAVCPVKKGAQKFYVASYNLLAHQLTNAAVAEFHKADTTWTLGNLTTIKGIVGYRDRSDAGIGNVGRSIDETDGDRIGLAGSTHTQFGYHLTLLCR